MEERLQKILAQAGIASRRGAEQLILQGRVSVNGKVVQALGVKADMTRDRILFDGKPLQREEKVYILLNKPSGYVTTLADPQGRPIVSDLVKDIPLRLFPVGRLDFETEGALIMTNDGELGNYILHPRYQVYKTYQAIIQGKLTEGDRQRLERGIMLDGKKTAPAKVRVLGQRGPGKTRVQIIIHEGKKRQVRKMFQHVGTPVLYLERTAYGKLHLGKIERGRYRFLHLSDLKKIFSGKIPFTINKISD